MNPNLDPAQLGLRDIHIPDAIGIWPLAIGWWILAGLFLVVGVVLAVRYSRRSIHRATCRALRKTADAIEAGADPADCALEASTILRRFAMTMAKNSMQAAGLVGNEWLSYLDSRWKQQGFSEGIGRQLLDAPYLDAGRVSAEDAMALCGLCVDWVNAQPARN